MMYELEELMIGTKKRIAEVGDWDYSWSLFAVFQDVESKQLFSTTDSGCSCNWPYDDPSYLDWKPLTSIHEAIAEARGWSGADKKDIEDFVSVLMGLDTKK